MNSTKCFRAAVERWVRGEPLIHSAVLFGSSARTEDESAAADSWSDLDLQIGTPIPSELERVDWAQALPHHPLQLQVVKPATGGVRKVTALFEGGQIDLVVVPERKLRALRTALKAGRHREPGMWRETLNEFHVCLRSGYRFLKGEDRWSDFYARVARELPGVRLGDRQITTMADVALVDLLWIFQKLDRGECLAAQFCLHRAVGETMFRLLRELRLRRGEPLPSFGLARRCEMLLPPEQQNWVRIDARAEREELHAAGWNAFRGLQALMGELVTTWRVAPGALKLLNAHRLLLPAEEAVGFNRPLERLRVAG